MVYSTDSSKAVVLVLVLPFVALWFILQGDLFNVLPCVILFLCFSVIIAFMRTEFLCVSVLRVVSGPRVKLASC